MRDIGQRGFTMLEVLITVTILGILATFAVPRFANATTLANTAKVASDLQTLDSAIAIYEMERGARPLDLTDLADYIADVESLKPPKGDCRLKTGETMTISSDMVYSLGSKSSSDKSTAAHTRAYLGTHTAGDFGKGD